MTMPMIFSNNSTRFSQTTSPTPISNTGAHPHLSMMQKIIVSKGTGCGSCGGK